MLPIFPQKKVTITSIKCSIKLPICVELQAFQILCENVGVKVKRFPSFLVLSRIPLDPLDSMWNKNCKLTLFRYRDHIKDLDPNKVPLSQRQHCNVAGLKSTKSLHHVKQFLSLLVDCDPDDMVSTYDNICGTKKFPLSIIKSDFVLANRDKCICQFESFPAIILKTPHKVTVLIYSTANCVFKGARSEDQLEKANKYIVKCFHNYLRYVIH